MTNFKNYRAGSEEQYEPRLSGDILTDMFSSDSPTAKTFHKSVTSHEDTIAKGKATTEDDTTAEWETVSFAGSGRFNNTELSSNVKTFLYFDHIAEIGKVYKGLFRRDSDEYFSFFEYRRTRKIQFQGSELWYQIQPRKLCYWGNERNPKGFYLPRKGSI